MLKGVVVQVGELRNRRTVEPSVLECKFDELQSNISRRSASSTAIATRFPMRAEGLKRLAPHNFRCAPSWFRIWIWLQKRVFEPLFWTFSKAIRRCAAKSAKKPASPQRRRCGRLEVVVGFASGMAVSGAPRLLPLELQVVWIWCLFFVGFWSDTV